MPNSVRHQLLAWKVFLEGGASIKFFGPFPMPSVASCGWREIGVFFIGLKPQLSG